MFLDTLVDAHIAHQNSRREIGRELSQATRVHLIDCVNAFSRWLGHRATINDLWCHALDESDASGDRRDFGDFLASIIASGQSHYTAKNRRTGLLIIWRFAKRRGLIVSGPENVRFVHCPPLDPNGFSIDQAREIIEHMTTLRGIVRGTGIPQSVFWPSFMRTKWDHALRAGDFTRVGIKDFDPTGWLWAMEQKTKKSKWHRLRDKTAEAIKSCIEINPKRDLIWPGYQSKGLCKAFTRIVTRCGKNGSAQWVRRGSSSELEKLFPGQAWRFLRHSTPQIFDQNYRVGKIVDENAPKPPEL